MLLCSVLGLDLDLGLEEGGIKIGILIIRIRILMSIITTIIIFWGLGGRRKVARRRLHKICPPSSNFGSGGSGAGAGACVSVGVSAALP
jgi:hypothetical protein